MYRVAFRVEVRGDLLDAAQWYEEQRAGLGREFMEEVDRALVAVRERPLAYRRVSGDVRRVLLRRFPYKIYYAVEADLIVVMLISHASRRPGLWRERR